MIQRLIEKKVYLLLEQFPCLGIVGSRQVGKTTLVKSLNEKLKKPFQYLDLELPEDRLKLTDPALYLSRFADHLIIIAEIQLMPELFPILRSLIDQNRHPGRFLILGSASPTLLSRSGESLAGRIVYQELNPFTINEIKPDNWESHWLKGGFPDAYLFDETNSWTWRNSFLNSYQTRDLPQLGLNASPIVLDRLFKMLASINGELLNVAMLSKSLGISASVISNYLDFLENSYLIRRLYSYSPNIRKRIVKSPKIYFRDSGLLHRILGVQTTEELYGSPLSGNSFESYVVQQIVASLNDTVEPYFYRTADGSEIDLILVKGINPLVSIEIKLSNAPKLSRGNTVSIADLQTPHNFVVTPSGSDYPLKHDLWVSDLQNIWGHLQELGLLNT
ncbi:ATP-binding protein [Runella sp.]|jgi:predicted AAA+ superfamily ATPase|uniref:ATP-binding protein n=1 Tax=Runella sp. TaxID=1960881 RepID=UPI003016F027